MNCYLLQMFEPSCTLYFLPIMQSEIKYPSISDTADLVLNSASLQTLNYHNLTVDYNL